MTTDYHTPWVDSTTEYKASDMNAPLAELDAAIGTLSGEMQTVYGQSGEIPYDMGFSYDGVPSASAVLARYPFPRNVTLNFTTGSSHGVCNVSAAAATTISLKRNGVEVGTCVFASGETTATFTGGAVSFNVTQVLTVVCPDPADANLSGIGISLAGYRT